MSRPFVIVKHGLEDKVNNLAMKGLREKAISNILEKEDKVNISFMGIRNYLNSINVKQTDIIQEEKKYMEELIKRKINILKTSERVCKYIEEQVKKHEGKNPHIHVKYIRELVNKLNASEKLLQSISMVNIGEMNLQNTQNQLIISAERVKEIYDKYHGEV